jgi:DNA-binding NarL/FixJ family response regulator
MDSCLISVLPPRERAVAALLGRGVTDPEICRQLDLTPGNLGALVERIGLGFPPSWGPGVGSLTM